MKKQRLVAIGLFIGCGAVLLVPFGLGLISNLQELITQIVAMAVVALLAGGLTLWWKGGTKRTREYQPKTFPNGVLIGNPLEVKKGVYRYRHKDAPPIQEMIDAAKTDVGALIVGGLFLTSHIDRDYERITQEKTLTFCLQPAGSPVLEEQARHTGSPNLSEKIRGTMELLRKRKSEITKKENLIVRNHEKYLKHSIVVFDIKDDKMACVRVVEYSPDPDYDWDTKIIFKSGNKKEYEKYLEEYRNVIDNHSWEVKLD